MAHETTDPVEHKLDIANPNDLPANLHRLRDETNDLGFGSILAAARPRNRSRTGLASSATQVHDVASAIYSVESPQGTPLAIISGGSPGAGEVSVDYNGVTGVPTLIFAGAVTVYHTSEGGALPQTLAATMATDLA